LNLIIIEFSLPAVPYQSLWVPASNFSSFFSHKGIG
jgi:hypothetical protein